MLAEQRPCTAGEVTLLCAHTAAGCRRQGQWGRLRVAGTQDGRLRWRWRLRLEWQGMTVRVRVCVLSAYAPFTFRTPTDGDNVLKQEGVKRRAAAGFAGRRLQ